MGIILKFILKSIMEKKLRTLLIITAIVISTALFFASTAMPKTLEELVLMNVGKYMGSSDIIFVAGEGSISPFFEPVDVLGGNSGWDYAVSSVDSMALHRGDGFELTTVKLIGMDYRDMQKFNPYTLISGSLRSLDENEIVIGKGFSEKHNIRLFNTLTLEIFGQEHQFRVVGIAHPTGPFIEDGDMHQFMVSPQKVRSSYGLSDTAVSTIFVKSNEQNLEDTVIRLNNQYENLTVKQAVPKEDIDFMVNSVKMPFYIVLGLVFFVSFFIIYTSFRLIMKERLPITGTFRSIGATKRSTHWLLICETLVYALVGGILGLLLGLGILKLLSYSLTSSWVGQDETKIIFSSTNVILSFLTAIIITLVSGIAPILSSTKFSIKDVILNTMDKPKSKKKYKVILGGVFILFALVVPNLVGKGLLFPVTLAAMLLTITAIVWLVPYLNSFLVILFEKIFQFLFGNIGAVACKNLRNNKSIIGSVTLLAIGIATLLAINVISFSVMTEVALTYDKYGNYDVLMDASRMDDGVLEEIRAMDNIDRAIGVMNSRHIKVDGHDRPIWITQGITPDFIDYWKLDVSRDSMGRLHGSNIIITSVVSENYRVKKGDKLPLVIDGIVHEFSIIDIFDTLTNNGDLILMDVEEFKRVFKQDFYTVIYVKGTGGQESIATSLREEFYHLNPFVLTLDKQAKDNHDSNAQIFSILNGFSILTMISGLLGIINNLIISFIERKRSLAMYRSLGMSRSQIIRMVFIESLTGGLSGGIIGVLGSFVLIINMPHLTRAMVVAIPVYYEISMFVYAILAGVGIMVFASISPAFKSSKLNIIESIKYE